VGWAPGGGAGDDMDPPLDDVLAVMPPSAAR
jgi:hypothetical protein